MIHIYKVASQADVLKRYQEMIQDLSELITMRIADKIDAGRLSSNYSDWPGFA